MHLDGDMAVTVDNITVASHHLRQLGIEYVTTLGVRTIPQKPQDASFPSSRAESDVDDSLGINDAQTFSLPSTSQSDSTDGMLLHYTKETKDTLLADVLSNPTIDDTDSQW